MNLFRLFRLTEVVNHTVEIAGVVHYPQGAMIRAVIVEIISVYLIYIGFRIQNEL